MVTTYLADYIFPRVIQGIDQELVRGAIAGEHFAELFFANAKDEQIIAYVRELLG